MEAFYTIRIIFQSFMQSILQGNLFGNLKTFYPLIRIYFARFSRGRMQDAISMSQVLPKAAKMTLS